MDDESADAVASSSVATKIERRRSIEDRGLNDARICGSANNGASSTNDGVVPTHNGVVPTDNDGHDAFRMFFPDPSSPPTKLTPSPSFDEDTADGFRSQLCRQNMRKGDAAASAISGEKLTSRCWILAFAVAFIIALNYGFAVSLPLLFADWQKDFGTSNALTIWVSAGVFSSINITGPFTSGYLLSKFSCRSVVFFGSILASASVMLSSIASHFSILFVFCGILFGVGFSMAYMPGIVFLSDTFPSSHAPLAYAIAEGGSPLGGMILPLLIEWLRQELSWRGAVLVAGAVLSHCCVVALLLRTEQKRPLKTDVDGDAGEGFLPKKLVDEPLYVGEKATANGIVKSREAENGTLMTGDAGKKIRRRDSVSSADFLNFSFVVFFVYLFFHFGGLVASSAYQVPYMKWRGVSSWQCATLLAIFAAFDLAGRLMSGLFVLVPVLSDSDARRRLFILNEIVLSVVVIAFSFVESVPPLAAVGAAVGLSRGVWTGLYWSVVVDDFGKAILHKTAGYNGVSAGVTILAAPPLMGLVADWTGRFDHVMLLSATMLIIATLMLLLWAKYSKRRK